MDSFELYKEVNGEYKPIGIYACGKCSRVFNYGGDGKEFAKNCCLPELERPRKCIRCGEKTTHFNSYCSACIRDNELTVLKATYKEAVKIDVADYAGPVYDAEGKRYYSSVKDYQQDIRDNTRYTKEAVTYTEFLFVCNTEIIQVDADSVIEFIEEYIDDNYPTEDSTEYINGEEELRIAIEAFNKVQTYEMWTVDYSKVVVGLEDKEELND